MQPRLYSLKSTMVCVCVCVRGRECMCIVRVMSVITVVSAMRHKPVAQAGHRLSPLTCISIVAYNRFWSHTVVSELFETTPRPHLCCFARSLINITTNWLRFHNRFVILSVTSMAETLTFTLGRAACECTPVYVVYSFSTTFVLCFFFF